MPVSPQDLEGPPSKPSTNYTPPPTIISLPPPPRRHRINCLEERTPRSPRPAHRAVHRDGKEGSSLSTTSNKIPHPTKTQGRQVPARLLREPAPRYQATPGPRTCYITPRRGDNRIAAHRQTVPGMQPSEGQHAPWGLQDQAAGSLSNSNSAGAFSLESTSSPAQVSQRGEEHAP